LRAKELQMKQKGPRDLHWLVALRQNNAIIGTLFFLIGVGFFGYLFYRLIF
jgi:hypothetical protein